LPGSLHGRDDSSRLRVGCDPGESWVDPRLFGEQSFEGKSAVDHDLEVGDSLSILVDGGRCGNLNVVGPASRGVEQRSKLLPGEEALSQQNLAEPLNAGPITLENLAGLSGATPESSLGVRGIDESCVPARQDSIRPRCVGDLPGVSEAELEFCGLAGDGRRDEILDIATAVNASPARAPGHIFAELDRVDAKAELMGDEGVAGLVNGDRDQIGRAGPRTRGVSHGEGAHGITDREGAGGRVGGSSSRHAEGLLTARRLEGWPTGAGCRTAGS
jgi:hypothetical protein